MRSWRWATSGPRSSAEPPGAASRREHAPISRGPTISSARTPRPLQLRAPRPSPSSDSCAPCGRRSGPTSARRRRSSSTRAGRAPTASTPMRSRGQAPCGAWPRWFAPTAQPRRRPADYRAYRTDRGSARHPRMGLSSFDGRDPTLELFDTTLVGLERAMSGSALRQQVIANNIANANTPNFKALRRRLPRGAGTGVRRPADRGSDRLDQLLRRRPTRPAPAGSTATTSTSISRWRT